MPDEPLAGTAEPLDAPNGMFNASVDRKGRLKLPVLFQRYLRGFGEQKLFVTSLDRKVGHIYTAGVWKMNRQMASGTGVDAKAAQRLLFTANDLGEDVAMDGEGRILLPTNMRRELKLEDGPVRVYVNRGRIEILSEAVYEERRRVASESSEEDLASLESAGFL
ncbi:MAG: hypothetical protein ACKV22_36765 [Bryobacteraceae bacterium]